MKTSTAFAAMRWNKCGEWKAEESCSNLFARRNVLVQPNYKPWFVGPDGILRPIGNRPVVDFSKASAGRFTIGRRLPTCPTKNQNQLRRSRAVPPNKHYTKTMQQRTLGRTGLKAGPIGMAAGSAVAADAVERAFERGVNYLYWGSVRRGPFGQALRNLKPQRDRLVLVLQSYSRVAALMRPSVEI